MSQVYVVLKTRSSAYTSFPLTRHGFKLVWKRKQEKRKNRVREKPTQYIELNIQAPKIFTQK